MPQDEFYLTHPPRLHPLLSVKDRIEDCGLIRENTGQRKPVCLHILRSVKNKKNNAMLLHCTIVLVKAVVDEQVYDKDFSSDSFP